jgi:hypothetical protein
MVMVEHRHEIGRYGDVVCPQRPPGRRNISELVMNLDDLIPNPHYRMCHSRIVGAPPTVVWDELCRVTMSALPLGRALEGVRLLPARLAGKKCQPLAGRTFLEVTPIPVLFSERPEVVISAGLSQAWRLLGGSAPPHLDAAALRAWSQPGWIKAGMEFRLQSTPGGTLLRTETPRSRDGPEDTAGLRGPLVVHPCGQ